MSLFLLFRLCLYVRLFDMYESSYAIIHKMGCIHCRCGMNENILNFVLSPLYQFCMKFLIPSVIKLGYKRCKNKKIKIFLLPIKISCFALFLLCIVSLKSFVCIMDREFGLFGCFEQICGCFWMCYDFRKLTINKENQSVLKD